jgi:ribokinase
MDMVVKTNRRPERGETLMGSDFFMSPGGKGANQAYAAGKLGASVAMIGRVGDDLFGDQLLSSLLEAGVNTTHIEQLSDESTGVALINIDAQGDNSIIVAPGANHQVTPDYIRKHEEVLSQAKLVLVQLEIPLESVVEAVTMAKKYNVPVMLDPAPAGPLPEELLGMVQYIVPNENEISQMTGAQVSDVRTAKMASVELLRKGVETVFSKLGEQGIVVMNANRTFIIPGYQVTAIDTTAAGDAFAGALATALVKGKDLCAATQFANAVGALTVTRLGAQSAMPDLAETEQFIKEFTQEQVSKP